MFQSLEEMESERQAEFLKMSYEERWDNLQKLVLINFSRYTEDVENTEESQKGIVLSKK